MSIRYSCPSNDNLAASPVRSGSDAASALVVNSTSHVRYSEIDVSPRTHDSSKAASSSLKSVVVGMGGVPWRKGSVIVVRAYKFQNTSCTTCSRSIECSSVSLLMNCPRRLNCAPAALVGAAASGGFSWYRRIRELDGQEVGRVHYLQCVFGHIIGRYTSHIIVEDVLFHRQGHQQRPTA